MRAKVTKADGVGRPEYWLPPLAKAKADAIARNKAGSLRYVAKQHKVSHETVRAIRAGEHWSSGRVKPVGIKGHPGW